MKIQDCMTREVDVISPSAHITTAAKMMKDGDYGALLVGEEDRLKGMITDRDIVIRGVALDCDLQTTTVGQVMSDRVVYCFEDDSVEEAQGKMSENQIRRLPILSREMRLVGVLSLGDISQSQEAGQTLAQVSQPSHRESARH